MGIHCVGIGMLLGAHLTPRARHLIETADVVFSNVSNGLVEAWLASLNANTVSLQPHYVPGRSRRLGYEAMVAEILAAGDRRVCAAFYGHPGVFAWVAHEVVARARARGIEAAMEPAISAEDCLYADLGIDPGTTGIQHYEATQLLINRRRIDPSAVLVLWQIAIVGDRSLARTAVPSAYRQLLVDRLSEDYPATHRCWLYRAATLPIESPMRRELALADLPSIELDLADTLVVPPAVAMQRDTAMHARLDALDRECR